MEAYTGLPGWSTSKPRIWLGSLGSGRFAGGGGGDDGGDEGVDGLAPLAGLVASDAADGQAGEPADRADAQEGDDILDGALDEKDDEPEEDRAPDADAVSCRGPGG